MPTNNPRLCLPSVFEKRVAQLISGFSKALPTTVSSLWVAGQSLTPQQVIAHLQLIHGSLTRVDQLLEAYHQALAERASKAPSDRAFYSNVANAMRQVCGPDGEVLALFGLAKPKVRAQLTVDARAIAKAKSDATRVLRGTKGKKQLQKLTLAGQSTLQVLGPDGKPITAASAARATKVPAPTGP